MTTGHITVSHVTVKSRCGAKIFGAFRSAGEQHAPGDRAAARRRDGDFGSPRQLPFACLAPQLQACLVQQPIAVHASRRQLPAIGVQRQGAVSAMRVAPSTNGPASPSAQKPNASSHANVRKVKPS